MNKKEDDYIETYTGKRFNFLDPDLDDIDIIDIAHSLSMQCRFTGHSRRFYSIAEHSLNVSSLCSESNKLWGLLHDATEAYLTDVASPIKPYLSNYKAMENKLMSSICMKYGLELTFPDEVKHADYKMLRIESQHLIVSRGKDWIVADYFSEDDDFKLKYYTFSEAKEEFLYEFYRLIQNK